ncbi:sugar transport protein 8-like [Telopea speciosissima]|uniref:sugar transport protein 8-like n=1 Tax=Telopea speciosissima TaxID=54955 RepID=UPI001CC73C1A|nr:sugar transport protein 8-like [Telopea speciosissima]
MVVSGGAAAEGKTTAYVIISAIMAAFGGLMFGYDNGIAGGVTSMDDFLEKFFHSVYEKKLRAHENNYCKYDNQFLQLFTSSLYISALVFSFVASYLCNKFGRRLTMRLAGVFFLVGALLDGFAVNLPMLIIGRVLLGAGVGSANQSVPLFISEIAPANIRGALNILFQLCVTIGILVANLVSYFVSKIHPYGWRIALGLAGVPAVILLLGSLVITDTPTSLVEREKFEEGRTTLMKIRDTANVDTEFDQIVHACELAKQVKDPYGKLMKRPSRPPLVISVFIQIFQQFTGINAIMFYAPVLFQTVGFKSDASLLSAVITGLVNVFSTLVSVYAVDRAGRRALLIQGAVQMFISQSIIGILLVKDLKPTGSLGHTEAIIIVLLVCLFVMSFAWSWGPLGSLIPSETFPVQTRTAGFAFAVSSNMLCTCYPMSYASCWQKLMETGVELDRAGLYVITHEHSDGRPVDDIARDIFGHDESTLQGNPSSVASRNATSSQQGNIQQTQNLVNQGGGKTIAKFPNSLKLGRHGPSQDPNKEHSTTSRV